MGTSYDSQIGKIKKRKKNKGLKDGDTEDGMSEGQWQREDSGDDKYPMLMGPGGGFPMDGLSSLKRSAENRFLIFQEKDLKTPIDSAATLDEVIDLWEHLYGDQRLSVYDLQESQYVPDDVFEPYPLRSGNAFLAREPMGIGMETGLHMRSMGHMEESAVIQKKPASSVLSASLWNEAKDEIVEKLGDPLKKGNVAKGKITSVVNSTCRKFNLPEEACEILIEWATNYKDRPLSKLSAIQSFPISLSFDDRRGGYEAFVTMASGTLQKCGKIINEKGKWYVKSRDGSKNLGGPYTSKDDALDRLKQVEYFKHNGGVELGVDVESLERSGMFHHFIDEVLLPEIGLEPTLARENPIVPGYELQDYVSYTRPDGSDGTGQITSTSRDGEELLIVIRDEEYGDYNTIPVGKGLKKLDFEGHVRQVIKASEEPRQFEIGNHISFLLREGGLAEGTIVGVSPAFDTYAVVKDEHGSRHIVAEDQLVLQDT